MRVFGSVCSLRVRGALVRGCVTLIALLTVPVSTALASGNAGYTTYDTTVLGCLHGSGVNCNLYSSKDAVYMSGGPSGGSGLSDGQYYFTVLAPGFQNGGFVDGADGNLSDATAGNGGPGGGDAASDRTFTVSGGVVTYSGSHAPGISPQGQSIVGLAPFDDTPNPGGVYILAVCKVGAASASDCKYDAFKVGGEGPQGLVVFKNAAPAFDRSFTWGITKDVDRTRVQQVGGSATFNYTVTVTKSAPTDSGWQVTGLISVFNPNDADVTGVTVTDDINDTNLSDTCVVTDGINATIPALSSSDFAYTCNYSAAPALAKETNTATATWGDQDLSNGSHLGGDAAMFDVDFTFDTGAAGNPDLIDNCATVSDPLGGGTLGTPCASAIYRYSAVFAVPQFDCVGHDNTARFVTNTTGTTGSASQRVTVCGPVKTGALTMGFWQNKNGQGIITGGASTSGVCKSGTWLRQYAPFQDLGATASCASVATYVTNVIKAATCTSQTKTCNAMLKAQMLATALDVYFSDPAL
ncbi:MAG: hypothetical protein QOD76_405, partial [Solirubrobacteraceae bacterium]|nr:hypothetical protein [Solirubrobacteraceae bacterium]